MSDLTCSPTRDPAALACLPDTTGPLVDPSASEEPRSPAEVTHVIEPGETLADISARYQLPQRELLASNPQLGGNADFIKAGSPLAIPIGEGFGVEPEPVAWQPGDTLRLLATAHGLAPGEQLWRPIARPAPAQAAPATAQPPATATATGIDEAAASQAPQAALPAAQPEPETPPATPPSARDPAPVTLTPGTAVYAQNAGYTVRAQAVADLPLDDDGSHLLRLTATQDRRATWDGQTESFLSRGYAHLQSTLHQGPALKLTGTLGGGFESVENPQASDKPLGYVSTLQVFNGNVAARYKLSDDIRLDAKVSALSIRSGDGSDWFRLNGQAAASIATGPLEFSLGALAQTDQRLGQSDGNFVALTGSATYKNPIADVSLQLWGNVAGKFVSPAVNAVPGGGGEEHGIKGALTLSHRFELSGD